MNKLTELQMHGQYQGRIQGGGGVLGVRNPPPFGGQDPPPPFWGTPKLHKEGKHRISVLNSYPDPRPLSEILYPPLNTKPRLFYFHSTHYLSKREGYWYYPYPHREQGSRYLHSRGYMVRTSVLKIAEIDSFEGKIRMSAISGKKGVIFGQKIVKIRQQVIYSLAHTFFKLLFRI